MLLSKARYFEHELLMVKASSFASTSGQRSFIFLIILLESINPLISAATLQRKHALSFLFNGRIS